MVFIKYYTSSCSGAYHNVEEHYIKKVFHIENSQTWIIWIHLCYELISSAGPAEFLLHFLFFIFLFNFCSFYYNT